MATVSTFIPPSLLPQRSVLDGPTVMEEMRLGIDRATGTVVVVDPNDRVVGYVAGSATVNAETDAIDATFFGDSTKRFVPSNITTFRIELTTTDFVTVDTTKGGDVAPAEPPQEGPKVSKRVKKVGPSVLEGRVP